MVTRALTVQSSRAIQRPIRNTLTSFGARPLYLYNTYIRLKTSHWEQEMLTYLPVSHPYWEISCWKRGSIWLMVELLGSKLQSVTIFFKQCNKIWAALYKKNTKALHAISMNLYIVCIFINYRLYRYFTNVSFNHTDWWFPFTVQ